MLENQISLKEGLSRQELVNLNQQLSAILSTLEKVVILNEYIKNNWISTEDIKNMNSIEIDKLRYFLNINGSFFLKKLALEGKSLIKVANLKYLNSYFLERLINNTFDILVAEKLLSYSELIEINNYYICRMLLSKEGKRALREEFFTTNDLIRLRDKLIDDSSIIKRLQELLSDGLLNTVFEGLISKNDAYQLTADQCEDLAKGSAYQRIKSGSLTKEEFLNISNNAILAKQLMVSGLLQYKELVDNNYICSITGDVINDPISLQETHDEKATIFRFERYALEKWIRCCVLNNQPITNPLTACLIKPETIKFDKEFKLTIANFLSSKRLIEQENISVSFQDLARRAQR